MATMATSTSPGSRRRAYGATSRWLHWITVIALVAQLVIGYVLDVDDSGRGRGRGRGGESGRGRGRGGDDDPTLDLGWNLLTAHVSLGLLIALLAVVRVAWRRTAGLPPWAEALTERERRWATLTERALLALLVVVPLTGVALVVGIDAGEDDLLALHVAGHLALYAALAAHVGLVLRRRLLPRML
jgi:cytochrome b561